MDKNNKIELGYFNDFDVKRYTEQKIDLWYCSKILGFFLQNSFV